MKNMKYALMVLVLVMSMTACKKSPEKLVVGTWKLTEISSPDLTDEAAKQEFYKKVTVSILENGNYDFAGFDDAGEQGTWKMSEDGKSFTTKSSDGNTDIATVQELTDKKFVMTMGGNKLSLERVKK